MSHAAMISLENGQKYFVHQHNLATIKEFARTFNADLKIVQVEESKITAISDLPLRICEGHHSDIDDSEVIIIEHVYPKQVNKRATARQNAREIRKFIRSELVAGAIVTLKSLRKQFLATGLSNSCLCNHFSAVRHELQKCGYKIEKQGAGAYQLQKVF